MDPTPDRTAQNIRVAQIRLDAELARTRIAETIDALEYKADVPARIGDVLSAAASTITARVLKRIPSPSRASVEAKEEPNVSGSSSLRSRESEDGGAGSQPLDRT